MKWPTYTPQQQDEIKDLITIIYHEFHYNNIYFDNWEEFVLELAGIIKSNHVPASLIDRHYKTDFANIKRNGNSEIRYQRKGLE